MSPITTQVTIEKRMKTGSDKAETAMHIRKKWLYTSIVLLTMVISAVALEPYLGDKLENMLLVTLSIYAVARGLNAVLSFAQGTEISAGVVVDVTLTPGELLDPLNDLIEQLSWVLLIASASIGIQQILLAMSDTTTFRFVVLVISIFTLLLLWIRQVPEILKIGLVKLVVILAVLRCVVPVMALTSHAMEVWIEDDRTEAVAVLQTTQQEISALQNDENSGWRDKLTDILALEEMQNKAEEGVEKAIYLFAEFTLQFVLLPIIFLWFCLLVFKWLLAKI